MEFSPDRRRFLKGALAAVLSIPLNTASGFLKALAESAKLPLGDQLTWFQNVLGPNGGLWPRLREGNFTDEELSKLFNRLGQVAEELNDPKSADPVAHIWRAASAGRRSAAFVYHMRP